MIILKSIESSLNFELYNSSEHRKPYPMERYHTQTSPICTSRDKFAKHCVLSHMTNG